MYHIPGAQKKDRAAVLSLPPSFFRKNALSESLASRLTRFGDVVFSAFSEKLGPDGRRTFAQSAYKKLAAYDQLHDTDYCRTLMSYIECGCSATAAASSLYVHRNTMTKRLNRLTEICGISLSDGPALIHFYLTAKMLGK